MFLFESERIKSKLGLVSNKSRIYVSDNKSQCIVKTQRKNHCLFHTAFSLRVLTTFYVSITVKFIRYTILHNASLIFNYYLMLKRLQLGTLREKIIPE